MFITFLYATSVVIGFPGLAQANTFPYFKVYGGDVFAGGAFIAAGVCNNGAGYHAPTTSPLTNQYNGGILAYAKSSPLGAGSSTNLGGFALGTIQGVSGSPSPDPMYGFYTGLATSIGSLSFAGPGGVGGSSSWGGLWQGTTPQAHCIPDYFSKQSSPNDLGSRATLNVGPLVGQNLITTGGILTVRADPNIGANQHVTVFVSGNVWINQNITYADRSTYDANTVPKFALVVKGNIYIDPSVTRLDGVYIAQPTSNTSTDTGVIWSCHDNSTDVPKDSFVRGCTNQLVVNGAFIAGQVNLLRTVGDVASAAPGESANGNIAEVFNFTPEMILGGPFFNPSTSNANRVESLISLPPVF